MWWCLLWWGVLDEVNALFNVGLEALDGNFEELLLGLGGVFEHVNSVGYTVGLYEQLVTYSEFQGLVSLYAEFDGNGEEIHASGLLDGFTTWHTRKVDKGRRNEALLTLDGLDHALGESIAS